MIFGKMRRISIFWLFSIVLIIQTIQDGLCVNTGISSASSYKGILLTMKHTHNNKKKSILITSQYTYSIIIQFLCYLFIYFLIINLLLFLLLLHLFDKRFGKFIAEINYNDDSFIYKQEGDVSMKTRYLFFFFFCSSSIFF